MINPRKKIKQRVNHRISEFCYHELKQCENVINAQGVFNHRCFENACQYASKHKGYEVVLGIYHCNKYDNYNLHFWVRKDNKDYEVSIGYLCNEYKYYEIKVIDKKDYSIIDDVFSDAIKYYTEKLTTPFERLFLFGARVL